jgi:restriction system protein
MASTGLTEACFLYSIAMSDGVTCSNCGTPLSLEDGGGPGDRKPCPKCGSTARTFSVVVSEILGVSATAQASVLRATISAANLLLQAVVVPSRRTHEGQLIEAVTLPWFEIINALSANPSLAYEIPARKWEEIIAGAYQKAGFDEVTLTPHSGDLGRDIIAVKRGLGTVRIIDQVKAYNPDHLVTADDVRALLGVLQGDKASKGFLTTTSDFAPRLREDILLKPFMPAQLELINGKMLLARLEELARQH